MATIPTFNNREYAYSDMQILFGGRIFQGVLGIEYKVSTDKETIYAAGDKPHSVQHGHKSYEGTLTLLQSEVEALDDAAQIAGYQDLTDITADIVVSYVPKGGGRLVTEVLKFVSFKEYQKGMKTGDKFMEVSLPFIFLAKERQLG